MKIERDALRFFMACMLIVMALVVTSRIAHAEEPKPFDLSLNAVSLQKVVALVWGEILKQPYMVDDLIKETPLTVNFKGATPAAILEVMDSYLASKDILRVERAGVNLFVPKGKEHQASTGSAVAMPSNMNPVAVKPDNLIALDPNLLPQSSRSDQVVYLYHARHRPTAELQKLVAVMLPASFVGDDSLLLKGSRYSVDLVKELLNQYDTQSLEVSVKATIVEYSDSSTDGLGLFGAINALSGKLGLTVGDTKSFSNALSFRNTSISAVVSMISQDSRFSVLDSASLRIQSGKTGDLSVGQDVPVLAGTQLDANGRPVQSISYRTSGVILKVKPFVVGDRVTAEVTQEVSSFAVTTTSNIDSPTMLRRHFSTNLTTDFNEVIFLGGLDETKSSNAKSGLFGINLSKNETQGRTTLFLVIQFVKV